MSLSLNPARWAGLLGLLWLLAGCNFPVGIAPETTPEDHRMEPLPSLTNLDQPTQISVIEPTFTQQVAAPQQAAVTRTATGATECLDRAVFIEDVTITDNTELSPGESFVKIWLLENAGTCTWTRAYSLSFFGGDRLGGATEVPLMGEVAPGEQIEVSVDLVAPESPGAYQGYWKLRNDHSQYFGIGPAGDQSFWVKIVVSQPLESPTPTWTATSTIGTVATQTPTQTPTPTVTPSGTTGATP